MIRNDDSFLKSKNKASLKFILVKIKRLVVDGYGDTRYMSNVDEVFKDIFGAKHFTKRLNDCYSDYETLTIIEDVGTKLLMKLCNTPSLYSATAELIAMNCQLYKLDKILRKAEKKGKKRDKSLVKEFEYLTEHYKRGIKELRRVLDVPKPKDSYKKKYHSVSQLIEKRHGGFSYGDDDDSIYMTMRDPFDDYDDDGDGYSDFERFVRAYAEPRQQQRSGSRKKYNSRVSQSALMSEDDDYDDYDDEEDDDSGSSDIDDRLDAIADNVGQLASVVQALVNTSNTPPQYPNNARRTGRVPQNQYSVPQETPQRVTSDDSLRNDIANITKAVGFMAKKQNDMLEQQEAIMGFIAEMAGPEYPDEEGILVNQNEQIPLSREELIELCNSQKPANLQATITTSTSSVVMEPVPGQALPE